MAIQSTIQYDSAIADPSQTVPAKTDVSSRLHATKKSAKNLSQKPSAVSKINDVIYKQLHSDLPLLMQLENTKHTVHQSIRLAQLNHLLGGQSHWNALLTPMATFGCISVHRRTRITVSEGKITQTPHKNSLDRIILECAFCNVTVSLAKVLSRFSLSGSAKCTMELLATLSTEHKAACRALKAVDLLKEDDVQFGVAEGNTEILVNANLMSYKSMQIKLLSLIVSLLRNWKLLPNTVLCVSRRA